MREASKAARRRAREGDRWRDVFRGRGLDIGPGDDPCDREIAWPIERLDAFDFEQGDANFIRQHFPDETFDFVHSSHSLEHMARHPWHCVQDWACLLKPGGHLVICVPDYEMYERRNWPSQRNSDHKWAFDVAPIPAQPWVLAMEGIVAPLVDAGMEVLHVRRLTEGWNPADPSDQTMSFDAGIECAWEILAVKRHHVAVRTPVLIRRQFALGDSIVVNPCYRHFALRHDVTFQTSAAFLDYHREDTRVTAELGHRADIDLDGYDQANPDVPLHLLGFHKARIPLPADVAPRLTLTGDEQREVAALRATPYALIDISEIPLMSRSVWFDVLEVSDYLDGQGLEVRYLEPCAPRDFMQRVAGAAVVIGRDSAPIQLAQALGRPYVAIMSSVRPEARYLPSPQARTLASPCPIGEDGCYHRWWLTRDCPVPVDGVAPCGIIDTPRLLAAIDEVLASAAAGGRS